MARHGGTPASESGEAGVDAREAEELRDRLTREWLAVAVADRGADVLGYDPRWWDGGAYDHCLVVRAGRDRLRIIESEGEAVVLPFRRRAAARALRGRRRPAPPQLTAPLPRISADDPVLICVDQVDVRRCSADRCGALLPIDTTGACPRCGRLVRSV